MSSLIEDNLAFKAKLYDIAIHQYQYYHIATKGTLTSKFNNALNPKCTQNDISWDLNYPCP